MQRNRRNVFYGRYFTKYAALVALLCSLTVTPPLFAGDAGRTPVISIIIDDIGYRLREDMRAIALPGPIAYAIMPQSPNVEKMALLAHQQGKDILVHMPMEAMEEEKNRFLGPGALTLNMTSEEFEHTLSKNMLSVPGAIGVNNHMGSLLTRHPGHMQWLMKSLHDNGKFYIDSVTSSHSVASDIARENDVPYIRRDVFLDNQQNPAYIEKQFNELIKTAKHKGQAVAIGHPHPETIETLARLLQQLDASGVTLISVQEMMKRQNNPIKKAETTRLSKYSIENFE